MSRKGGTGGDGWGHLQGDMHIGGCCGCMAVKMLCLALGGSILPWLHKWA